MVIDLSTQGWPPVDISELDRLRPQVLVAWIDHINGYRVRPSGSRQWPSSSTTIDGNAGHSQKSCSSFDSFGREVRAGDDGAEPRPTHRVSADVALEVNQPLARYVPDAMTIELDDARKVVRVLDILGRGIHVGSIVNIDAAIPIGQIGGAMFIEAHSKQYRNAKTEELRNSPLRALFAYGHLAPNHR